MWKHDCSFVPVVDEAGSIVGALTARDICIATATRGLLPEHISAALAMTTPVHGCRPDDSVTDALATMKQFRVRRLPVIDSHGRPEGVISMNDIVVVAAQNGALASTEVVSAMAFICLWRRRWRDFHAHRPPYAPSLSTTHATRRTG